MSCKLERINSSADLLESKQGQEADDEQESDWPACEYACRPIGSLQVDRSDRDENVLVQTPSINVISWWENDRFGDLAASTSSNSKSRARKRAQNVPLSNYERLNLAPRASFDPKANESRDDDDDLKKACQDDLVDREFENILTGALSLISESSRKSFQWKINHLNVRDNIF